MIEADANGDDAFKHLDKLIRSQGQMFASQRDELEELVRDVRVIMEDYFDYWKDAAPKDRLTFLRRKGKSAEHSFEVPLVDGIEVTGKLDAIAVNGEKRRCLVENKTFRAMPSEDHRWRNLQSNIYFWCAKKLDIALDAICWNYIRSKSPTVPQLLKAGGVSKKRLDTLPAALRAFSKENRLKLPPRMIETAAANRKSFFTRIYTRENKDVVKSVVRDFTETAVEIAELSGKRQAKTIDRHCEWCEFEAICRAELQRLDVDYVIKKEYEVRERKIEVEIQTE
jgi:hypothetical protein